VYLFTAAMGVLAASIFGLAPALRATAAPMQALREYGRGAEAPGRMRAFHAVLITQVAVSLLLLVAAGLFVRTAQQLARVPLGFDPEQAVSMMVTAPTVPAADRNVFYHRLVDAVAAAPGVASAGGSIDAPLTLLLGGVALGVSGARPLSHAETVTQLIPITPGWLSAYRTPILAGRDVADRDVNSAARVMLVNEAFVRRFFPGEPVLDRTLALSADVPPTGKVALPPMTVVGIVADAVYSSIREPSPPTIYTPLAQRDGPIMFSAFFIVVRPTAGSTAQLTERVAAALRAVDPDLRVTFRPVADRVNAALAQDRLIATLAAFAGALALVLAGLGLYGVTAYAVWCRRTEIGIRLAVGSTPSAVIRLVLSRVLALAGVGVFIGGGISLWLSPVTSTLLYGVEPRDPVALAAAAVVLITVAVVAGASPAWRASRTDPAQTLRT
jgi:predicted permease